MKPVKHLETGMDLWSTATPLVCVARSVCDVRSEKTVRSGLEIPGRGVLEVPRRCLDQGMMVSVLLAQGSASRLCR